MCHVPCVVCRLEILTHRHSVIIGAVVHKADVVGLARGGREHRSRAAGSADTAGAPGNRAASGAILFDDEGVFAASHTA